MILTRTSLQCRECKKDYETAFKYVCDECFGPLDVKYDFPTITKSVVNSLSIPVIASGGCGKPDDMVDIFQKSNVDAALAASIFHYETHGVSGVKKYLKDKKIPVRL